LLILTAWLLPASSPAQRGGGDVPFKLVVNASNPVASISKEQAAKLFYRKQRAWPSGEVVVPVDLAEQVAARKAFSTRVLGKDAGSMKGYWQQMIFTGKGVPPIEKATEAEALAFVAATPGAVGYVAAGTPLPAGVKSVAYQE
jgi:ABC-type phosphate transport system substrate-binding protein